jgi:hypothetical protein
MPRLAAALVLVVFAVGALLWFRPSVTSERELVASTPSLDGISVRNEVKVPGRGSACIRPVPLDPRVGEVQLILNSRKNRPAPLALTLRGPGYAGQGRFAGYPGGDPVPTTATLSARPSRTSEGELCVRNTGRRAVWLVGTSEGGSLTLPVTYVQGKQIPDIDPAITFFTGERGSTLSQLGTVFERAAGFTGVIPSWLMWPLVLVFFLGVPLATAAALLLSARRTDDSSARTARQ